MRSRARWLTILTVLAATIGVGAAPPAFAATTTCSFNGGVLTISSDTNANTGQYVRVARSGQLVLVVQHDEAGEHLVDCGSPMLSETLEVDFTGAVPAPDFAIDETGGRFIRSSGQEVLFDVHMPGGDSAYSTVGVLTYAIASRVVAGSNGVDLHDDGDVDLTMTGIDSLSIAGSYGADTLSANGGGERGGAYASRVVLLGYGGNDTLRGGSTADLLLGGEGADTMYGGAGMDKLGPVQAIYNEIDTFGKGNDRLYGQGGNDTLAGGADNDLFDGGTGADAFAGNSGVDTVSYAAAPSRVTVRLDGSANDGRTIGGVSEGDNVVSIENVNGSIYADVVVGNAAANQFNGGDGADTLSGADGNDVLNGQDGDDTLNGGAHTDTCRGGAGSDTVQACENS